jgi:hypothetical protein
MDLKDSTQGSIMVFCEHLQTVGSTKLGSFFTSYQVFQKDPASWSYLYCIHKKKIPIDRGGDDTLASSILPTVLLPSPLVFQPAEGACHYQHSL